MKSLIATVGIGAFAAAFVMLFFLWPLIVLWAVNTIFSVGIPYTFTTWLAALILIGTINPVKINHKG